MGTPVEGPRVGQVWKKNQIIGLKEDKDQEELTYINDNCLFSVLLLTGGMPTSFLFKCASLPCFYLNKPFLCILSPTCCYAMYLIINLVPAFTSSASMINVFFTGGRDPGKLSF